MTNDDDSDFVDIGSTRGRQESKENVRSAHAVLEQWGAYNLLKARPIGNVVDHVTGYFTLLQTLSGQTPEAMENLLGLIARTLANGADIYRLGRVPTQIEFIPHGYSTLVGGLILRDGLKQDRHGYRPGLGAIQYILRQGVQIPAVHIRRLAPGEPFAPGLHPRIAKLYGQA